MNRIVWLLTIIVLVNLSRSSVTESFAVETHQQILVFTTPEEEGVNNEYSCCRR